MCNPLTRSILNKHINYFFIKHSELKREKSTDEKIKTNFVQGSVLVNIYYFNSGSLWKIKMYTESNCK